MEEGHEKGLYLHDTLIRCCSKILHFVLAEESALFMVQANNFETDVLLYLIMYIYCRSCRLSRPVSVQQYLELYIVSNLKTRFL